MSDYNVVSSNWQIAPSYMNVAKEHGLIAYIHIPRSGGSTLIAILRKLAATVSKKCFAIDGSPRYLGLESYPLDMSKCDEEIYTFIHGHFSYGIHEYIDSSVEYTTVIREPISRVISDMQHSGLVAGLQESPQLLEEKFDFARKLPPDERALYSDVADNLLVRMICGDVPLKRFCNEEDVERAKIRAHDDFYLIGLMENFNLFLSCLLSQSEFPSVAYKAHRIRKEKLEISASLREKIAIENRLDIILYDWVVENIAPKTVGLGQDIDTRVVWAK